jgi:hypothetical protein
LDPYPRLFKTSIVALKMWGLPSSFNNTPFEADLITFWKNDIKMNIILALNSPCRREPIPTTREEINYHNCGWEKESQS